MKKSDRAERDFVESGWNVGIVTAIRDLFDAGWSIEQVADQMPLLQKHAGNESIRAAGLNGSPRVANLHEHMETYGGGLAFRLRELRSEDIAAN